MITENIVGVLELASKYRYGLTSRGAPIYLFRPYDSTRPAYIVGCSEKDTSRNRIAIVQVTPDEPQGGEKPRGLLMRILGPVGDDDAEAAGLLEHYCSTRQLPKQDLPPVDTKGDDRRESLDPSTGWRTFHIDPPDCVDIDDAIAYNPGNRCWAITIADAAAAVPDGHDVDTRAREIGSTFYDTDGSVDRPMLPRAISENNASLRQGEQRRGVTLFLDENKSPIRFALTWITVSESFSYNSFVGTGLAKELGNPEPHAFIEEMMITYNKAAAKLLVECGVGLLRAQGAAEAAVVAKWKTIHTDLSFLANEAANYVPVTDTTGHAGLNAPAYCHASSPLRRYADLVNQRIIKAHVLGDELPVIDVGLYNHLNARTKANRRYTRDLIFLENVSPRHINTMDIIWLSDRHVWVKAWKRIIPVRHSQVADPGTEGMIDIFCAADQVDWQRRILTAKHLEQDHEMDDTESSTRIQDLLAAVRKAAGV